MEQDTFPHTAFPCIGTSTHSCELGSHSRMTFHVVWGTDVAVGFVSQGSRALCFIISQEQPK